MTQVHVYDGSVDKNCYRIKPLKSVQYRFGYIWQITGQFKAYFIYIFLWKTYGNKADFFNSLCSRDITTF